MRAYQLPRKTSHGLSVDEKAASWIIRMKSGEIKEAEKAAFEKWHNQSEAHAKAYKQAEATWAIFGDHGDDPILNSLRASALAAGPSHNKGRWLAGAVGLAASIFVAIALTGHLPFLSRQGETTLATNDAGNLEEYVTAKGERKTLRLSDGSAVTLNTDSSVRVNYSSNQRIVHLLHGQALFEVAKDTNRPFVVQASDQQIMALGTIFEVMVDTNLTKVTLIEGKVSVEEAHSISKQRNTGIRPTILSPGNALIKVGGLQPELVNIDLDQQLRWREGFVEFHDTPLADAVKEMNRYSQNPIRIAATIPETMRVSGVFRTGNNDRFASIISEFLPIDQRTAADGSIELARRP